MRYLAARNPKQSAPIVLIPMRGKYDCLTCTTAMLLGIEYEDVEKAFGGNIDPSKDQAEESQRLQIGFEELIQKHKRGVLHLLDLLPITEGRRYWVGVRINDPSNALSQSMSHSLVIDEVGKVFDPNPQYGEFKSLKDWRTAMTLPHELEFATEIFEYSL